jgi:hypothetical protein
MSLGKIDKSAKKTASSFEKTFQGIKANYLNLRTAVTDVIQGIQKAWDFAKHGAAVQQTEQSWDFLLKKLGTAPDILNKMRQEARGTVDDMTIMSSTMTLLAGTSDELGKALLEQSPQLLKIAKAANKLNPSLGDTAFLYESISKGIKRASPLVLDNLGLVIKMGPALEAQAKALGKSVDALNSDERAMAILNDTMRAGNLLIEQVGGNVDAAGDSYARMEVAVTSLKDELAALASEGLEPTVTVMAEVVKTSRVNVGTWGLINQALRDGTITGTEYNEWIIDYLFYGGKQSELLDKIASRMGLIEGAVIELTGHERAYIEQIIELVGHERAYVEEVEDATKAMYYANIESVSMTQSMYDAAEAGKAAAVQMRGLEGATESSAEALRKLNEDAKQLKIDEFFDVDLGIGDVAARMFDITQFKEMGGEALELMVNEVKAGLAEKKITPEQAKELFVNIAAEAAGIEIKMGKIDVSDAAQAIADDFNMPLAESRKLIDNVIEGIDLVNSTDISAITKDFDNLQERKEILMEAGEFDLEVDPNDEMQSTLEDLQEQKDTLVEPAEIPMKADPDDVATKKLVQLEEHLFVLTDDPWIIEVEIQTRGGFPKPTGGTVTVDEGPDYHQGGDFIVPSGFTNKGFPMQVHTGERVTVQTRSQQGRGRERIIYQRIGNINNFVQNSAAWAAWVDQQQQTEFDEIDRSL